MKKRKINPKILEPFPDEDRELVALIAILIKYDIDARKYTEKVGDQVNSLVRRLLTHDLIEGNFEEDAKVRWNLTVPLDKSSYSTNFIEEFRRKFSKTNIGQPGMMGDKYTITSLFEDFREKYPDYDEQSILEATDKYLQNCLNTETFIMQADNFIERRLLSWLEQEKYVEQEDNAI